MVVDAYPGQGIKNEIQWESYSEAGGTWYLYTLYGKKRGDVFDIYWETSTAYLNHSAGIRDKDHYVTLPIDAPTGVYDAWTVMSTEGYSGDIDETNILGEKYDAAILYIHTLDLADIISTNFVLVL